MRFRFKMGEQRNFLDLVALRLSVSSLRGILQFGFDVPYSTLKNYYSEVRLMPRELVVDMCEVAGISLSDLDFEEVAENWGRIKGGKLSKRKS